MQQTAMPFHDLFTLFGCAAPMIVLGHPSEAQPCVPHRRQQADGIGTWDDALLSAELNALLAEDYDLSLVGFSDGELNKLLAYVPEGEGDGDGEGGAGAGVSEPPRNPGPASRTGDL